MIGTLFNLVGATLEIFFFMLLGAVVWGNLQLEWWQLWLPIIIAIPCEIIGWLSKEMS